MEEGTPTKPPRGVKQKQETSRLLMTTIQSLCNSKSDEQREKEKQKLERDYEKSNKKLEELVSKNYGELTRVMQAFGRVSSQITSSRERMSSVRRSLEECKILLRCRREELRKLWLESIEHKHALILLDKIAQIREIPGQVGQHLAKKQYTAATQVLLSGLSLSEGELADVEALREVRGELSAKRQMLFTKLLEELHHYVYVVPTTDSLPFRRQGSGKEALSPFQRGMANLRGSKGARARRRLLDVPQRGAGDADAEYDDESDGVGPQERAEMWFNVISDCLCLLKKLHESIDAIKTQMQKELQEIIPRTTREIIDSSQTVPTEDSGEGKQLLIELLGAILDRMRRVAAAHSLLLRVFNRTCLRHGAKVRLYDMGDVWTNIQIVLQQWLSDYLGSGATESDTTQPTHLPTEISSFFSKRRPARKKVHLFKFQRSLSSFSFMKEHKENSRVSQTLVCPADVNNITALYRPLREILEELEGNGSHQTILKTYIEDHIKNVFLIAEEAKQVNRVAEATRDKDAWRAVTDSELTKKLGLARPLLQSSIVVEKIITELRGLLKTLPDFFDSILHILVLVLSNYREVSTAAYRGIVQPDSEDKRIFSSAWLKDEDINRFLKSLPNWAELQAYKPTHRNRRLRREETAEEESPEDVRQRNVKEADMLASNIGEGGVHRTELLSDITQLKKLAQLHESMEWLSAQILLVNGDLKALREEGRIKSNIPEQNEQMLFQLVHEFTELADICLMVLHLEVRVQCFHYLPSTLHSGQRSSNMEPDSQVTDLSKVLIAFHEVMVACLQPRKTKYIFEGLGHLIAKILISTAQYMERVDESSVDRMGRNILTLQQTLSHMTATRDLALDHTKMYFDLFHLTPDEVLAGIVERGPTFTDMEYINALQLLHRSHPGAFGSVKEHLERLSDILGETGVTV